VYVCAQTWKYFIQCKTLVSTLNKNKKPAYGSLCCCC